MRIDASGIINTMAAIIAALPKEHQSEVLETMEYELVISGSGYYGNARNANQLGAMDDWEWTKLKEQIERLSEEIKDDHP